MVTVRVLGEYALWLVPSGEEAKELEEVIKDISDGHPNSPPFEPHITLWYPVPANSDVEDIESELKKIAKGVAETHDLSTLSLELGPPQAGDFYYQCVLSPVTPNSPLLALRKAVENVWGPSDKNYFPHLSLMYGDLEKEEKETVISQLADKQLPKRVDVKEILVVDSKGPADQWKVVSRVQL